MNKDVIERTRYDLSNEKAKKYIKNIFDYNIEKYNLKIDYKIINEVIDLILFIGNKEENKLGNVITADYLLTDMFQCITYGGDKVELYRVMRLAFENANYITKKSLFAALNNLDSIFNIRGEKFIRDINLEDDEFVLNEEELCRIMEEHHRIKWNRYMRFYIEKPSGFLTRFEGVENISPRYLYKYGNEEFILNEELLKTILCEYLSDIEIDDIEFIYYVEKSNYKDLMRNVQRTNNGGYATDEGFRMARHPEMYQGWDCKVIFQGVKIKTRNKINDINDQYVLSL